MRSDARPFCVRSQPQPAYLISVILLVMFSRPAFADCLSVADQFEKRLASAEEKAGIAKRAELRARRAEAMKGGNAPAGELPATKISAEEGRLINAKIKQAVESKGLTATTERAENKAHATLVQAARELQLQAREGLDPKTFKMIETGLSVESEHYIPELHRRLSMLPESEKANPLNRLSTRDPLGPDATQVSTGTFYTSYLEAPDGLKFQPRFRRYTEFYYLDASHEGETITLISNKSDWLSFTKQKDGNFRVVKKLGGPDGKEEVRFKTTAEIRNQYGDPVVGYATHGKSIRGEIKARLADEIDSPDTPMMSGPNIVRKPDIPFSDPEFYGLVKKSTKPPSERTAELLERIAELRAVKLAEPKANPAVVNAYFDVLKLGVQKNPQFLEVQNYITYPRYAFELKTSDGVVIQKTYDLRASAHTDPYSESGVLRPPSELETSGELTPSAGPIVFVEQKTSAQAVPGAIKRSDMTRPGGAEDQSQQNGSLELRRAWEIFEKMLKPTNNGKNNTIWKKRTLPTSEPE